MYIKIRDYDDPDTWHTYTTLKSLTFAPEVDFPSSTIPVNEFVAEIVTTDEIPTMQDARLYDDMDALWAAYYVTEANRTSRKTVRLVAQSALALMDRWTWGAEMIQNMSLTDFVLKLFGRARGSDAFVLPKAGTIYSWLYLDFEVDPSLQNDTITGFFPEQTARERLQWLCVHRYAFVLQFASEKVRIAQWGTYQNVPLIPLSDTYSKPRYIHNQPVNAVYIRSADNFTTADSSGADGYASSTDDDGVKWWYRKYEIIEGDRGADGEGLVLADLTMDMGSSTRLEWLLSQDRIEIDVINNGQYWPGQIVMVYLDEYTIYQGMIMSCDFQFGLQAKSRMVIRFRTTENEQVEPVTTGTVNLIYVADGLPIGHRTKTLPEGTSYDETNPAITWNDGRGGTVTYSPASPHTSGETAPGVSDVIVEYVQHYPARIEIETPPTRTEYIGGDKLSYDGMVVRIYDNFGMLWPNEYYTIPLSELILPETHADIQKGSDEGGLVSDLNILPSLEPVNVGTYSSFTFNESHWNYGTQRVQWEYLIEGGLLTANVRLNPDGTARSFVRYIFASESSNTRYEERITQVNGQVAADEFYTIGANRSYTHAGKKVYYKPVFSSNAYSDNHYVGPVTDYTDDMTSASPVGATAWTMIYGHPVYRYQDIPVRWQVPGTRQVLEDTFRITVQAKLA